ncbi:MAG: Nudix family hydrolase [Burkholderiales bacterium]
MNAASDASPTRWIEVAAAVIERDDGAFLLAQRPAGKVYEGWWEFPGGKVEAGEPVSAALARELEEELGLHVEAAFPWITRTHRYPHGNVRLRFFRVVRWHGEPHAREGQAFAWQTLPALTVDPILPANGPILKALGLPLFMGVSQATLLGTQRWLERLEASIASGLRWVQIREPGWTPSALEALAREAVDRMHPVGGRVVVNGNRDVARAVGADGVHLSARALRDLTEHPPLDLVGASVHDANELALAEALGVDYVVLGPVRETASHPGASGIGWAKFASLAAGRPFPVLAIGGLDHADLDAARQAGAHGIAAIRGAWQTG